MPIMTTLGVIGVLLAGTACGALNGVIVVYGRLQPIIVTIATGAVFFRLALILRPQPGGSVNPDLADLMTRSTYWVPSSLIILLAVVLFIWIPYRRSVIGRAAYAIGSSEQAAYMSGVADRQGETPCLCAGRPALGDRRPVADGSHLHRRGARGARGRLHAQFDRRGGDRRHVAVRRLRQRHRLDLRRVRDADGRRPPVRVRHRTRCCSRCSWAWFCCSRSASVRCGCSASRTSSIFTGRRRAMNGLKKLFSGIDKATAIAFACILLLLFLGALYDPNFLSRGVPAAATPDRLLPRRHRDRDDAGHPARPHRPVDSVDDHHGRHDGDRRRPGSSARRSATSWPSRSASSRACWSASSTASASPTSAHRR